MARDLQEAAAVLLVGELAQATPLVRLVHCADLAPPKHQPLRVVARLAATAAGRVVLA